MMGAHFCLRMGQSAMANKTTLADCYRSSSGTTTSCLLKYLKDSKLTFLQAFLYFISQTALSLPCSPHRWCA